MASLNSTVSTPVALPQADAAAASERRRAVRDSLIVAIGGQLERALGTLTALALRSKWLGLDPARMGVYTGLRLYLDNTNRSSLGISLGAVQEIPILRASGRHDEAQRVANVAYTTNTLTCLFYAAALITWAWLRQRLFPADALADAWTWGLVAIAGLALIKRYQDFLIAVLRAYQEFELTTRLAVVDALVSAVLTVLGLWLAGLWGVLASVGLLLLFNIFYLHARHPLRFGWAWEWPTILRLLRTGLPILANTAAFGAVLNLDRVLILWRIAEGERALGLYSIALMGTSWSLDLAGRIALVMYTYFQTTLGRTRDEAAVARQALRTTEAQAPILAAGGAVAYLVGPTFLGLLMPRYADGLPALRPLLPGMVILGLAWPARQMLITIDRPIRLFSGTLLGLGLAILCGAFGADRSGLVGVAWGMSAGYALVYLCISGLCFYPWVGRLDLIQHYLRVVTGLLWYAAGAIIAAHVPLVGFAPWGELAIRCAMLIAWILPALWVWGQRCEWGGVLRAPRQAA